MKKICFFLTSIILFSTVSIGQSANTNSDEDMTLSVNVKNIKQKKGKILIAVFDNEEQFMKHRISEKTVSVEKLGNMNIELKLPKGKYAITLFHDINDNNELNTNLIGIPKEPYGFSNNPRIVFGPPGFKQTSFDLMSNYQMMDIVLK